MATCFVRKDLIHHAPDILEAGKSQAQGLGEMVLKVGGK